MKRCLFAWTALAALAVPSSAQDNHYWTTQFGNRSRLLGGAVVGGDSDSSAVYYNPGALALTAESEILLSGTVFQFENVGVANALGPGVDLSNTRWSLTPSLLAGELRLKALGKNRLAYAFLTRYDGEIRVNELADVTDLLRQSIPGIRYASKEVEYETRLREYWVGGSWSRKVGEKTAVGVSPFFAIRNHRARAQDLTQALSEVGQGGISIRSQDFDYQHWRLLAKAGIATRLERWDLGLTLTTPSLPLFGNGWSGINRSAVGQDVDQDGNELTQITTDAQEGLEPHYKSPLSVAVGGTRSLGRSRIHFTAEWFDGIAPRNLLEPEPFPSQSSGEIIEYDTSYAADPVLNAAFGFERRFTNDLQLYTAFTTDFSSVSASDRAESAVASFATWDIYHLSGGFTFKVVGQELTLGLTYSFGRGGIGANNLDLNPDLEVTFRRLTFVLGAGFLF